MNSKLLSLIEIAVFVTLSIVILSLVVEDALAFLNDGLNISKSLSLSPRGRVLPH